MGRTCYLFNRRGGRGDFCVYLRAEGVLRRPSRHGDPLHELARNILDVFNEYGVQIMTPAYEKDPKEPKVVPKEQWFAAPAQPPRSPALSTSQSGASRLSTGQRTG